MASGSRKSIFDSISGLLAFGGGDTCVGLSIGSSSIKLIELKKSKKTWKLVHFGIVQLPEESVINREISNHVQVVESLKTLVNQLRLKSKAVCSSLGGTSVIVKRMEFEVPNPREMQDQVFWEAEQYLPFDASEVVMDFHVISRGKDSRTDILFVAAKTAVLESYMAAIEDAGLQPKIMDLDFFALQNAYEANYPQSPHEAVALVDLGASSTKVVVIHSGVPVLTKESATGGNNLTAEIQRHLNLSFADAEALKTSSHAEAMPQEVNDLMQLASENIAQEIKRSIDFYSASSASAPISSILLAGGGSKIPGLSRIVEEKTGLPTQILNPFNSISYDPAVFTQDYVTAIAPLASIAVGLALRAGAP